MTWQALSPDDLMALRAAGPQTFRDMGLCDEDALLAAEWVSARLAEASEQGAAVAVFPGLDRIVWANAQHCLAEFFHEVRLMTAARCTAATIH